MTERLGRCLGTWSGGLIVVGALGVLLPGVIMTAGLGGLAFEVVPLSMLVVGIASLVVGGPLRAFGERATVVQLAAFDAAYVLAMETASGRGITSGASAARAPARVADDIATTTMRR